MTTLTGAVVLFSLSCGGGGTGGEVAAAPRADASSFSAYGLSMVRPDGWVFIAPDSSVASDAVVLLQGPAGEATLAPVVEVGRRPLNAADRRRKASHILAQTVLEISQAFDGYQAQGSPEDLELAGVPAAKLVMRFTESLPDGGEVERIGSFYGLVHGSHIWVVRCLGPTDGSAQAGFDAILSSIEIEE